jgi:glucose-6-phosphate 1-epimerase
MRDDAVFDGAKPIAGGLPLCFPQFGPGKLPQHGFVRDLTWQVVGNQTKDGVCVLELIDNEETRAMWPHAFRLIYRVELLEGRLSTTLTVENPSETSLSFQAGLHSYFNVEDVKMCTIAGNFAGAEKIDKTIDPKKRTQATSNTIAITKFTEEAYMGVFPGTATISDPAKGNITIENDEGWADTIVWNPYGNEKMGAERFICVESLKLDEVQLKAKSTWSATMSVVPKPKA